MKKFNSKNYLIITGALCTSTAAAEFAGVSFSAQMIQRTLDGQVIPAGKMYVGNGRMRIEITQQGRQIVRINDQVKHKEWVLFPAEQRYLEHTLPSGTVAPGSAAQGSTADFNPCEGLPNLTCQKIGEESVLGRPAIKWEMTVTRAGQTLKGAQWLDVQRGLPLKYQMPNGQGMELKLIGTDNLEGRALEKWEMTNTVPNQAPSHTLQWYDPELKLTVREELPNKSIRELTQIQIAPQPDSLFTIPTEYTRMEMPSPPPPANPNQQ